MTDKLTRKSIEALEGARKLALRRNHQAVGVPHLLAALLEQTDGLVLQLIRKAGASVESLRAGAERLLDRIPSVSGPGARQEADKYYVTNELQKLLDDVYAGACAGMSAMLLEEDEIRKADDEELEEIARRHGL